MTIDDLARTASAELNASVRRTVSAERARTALTGRLRRRRAEQVLAVVALVAVSLAGLALVRDVMARPAVPVAPPTVDRAALPASGCLFDVTCTEGTYRAGLTVPTTFSTAGLLDVSSDTAFELDLTEVNDTFALTLLADPGAAQPDGRPVAGTGPAASADDLAAALRARSDLEVTAPTPTEVAGRPALVVDVRAKAGITPSGDCPGLSGSCLPLFTTGAAGGGWSSAAGLATAEVDRVFLVDVSGSGTVVIVVRDRTGGDYAPLVAMTQVSPILQTLAFGE